MSNRLLGVPDTKSGLPISAMHNICKFHKKLCNLYFQNSVVFPAGCSAKRLDITLLFVCSAVHARYTPIHGNIFCMRLSKAVKINMLQNTLSGARVINFNNFHVFLFDAFSKKFIRLIAKRSC